MGNININNMDIEKLVKFINSELSKNKTLSINKFCEMNNIKKNILKNKISIANYSYNPELRQYIKDNITSNTTEVFQEVAVTKEDNTSSITRLENIDNVDLEKLNLLLNNLDGLLKLVKVKDNTSSITINSDKTRVTSLRINEELYKLIKDRSAKESTSISDIVNRALLDYLNNYI